MEVIYHPRVRAEVLETLRYYTKISPPLADDFHDELRSIIATAAENPLRFHLTERGFRRANMPRFPYHVIYETRSDSIRVMVVRHNKRHPDYGQERQ